VQYRDLTVNRRLGGAMPVGSTANEGLRHQLVRRDLPSLVIQSWDWRTRCDSSSEYLARYRGVNRQLTAAIEERIRNLSPFRSPIPERFHMDLAYARRQSEVGYLRNLSELVHDKNGFDPKHVHPDFLSFADKLVGNSRTDKGWYGAPSSVNHQLMVPLACRRFERHARHVHRVAVPYFCREIDAMTATAVATRYPGLPSWWPSREGSYSDLTELPPCLSYYSNWAMDPYSDIWIIAQTELAALRMTEVLVSARAGRLLWISNESITDIRDVGVEDIFYYNNQQTVDDAKACLEWIAKINWDETSAEARHLPGFCNEITPTFEKGGDWVAWDPVNWRPLNDVAVVDTPVTRARLVAGSTDRLAQLNLPAGRGGAAHNPSVRGRGYRSKDISAKDLSTTEHVVRWFLSQDPALEDRLSTLNGGRRPATMVEFFDVVKLGFEGQGSSMEVDTTAVVAEAAQPAAGSTTEPQSSD